MSPYIDSNEPFENPYVRNLGEVRIPLRNSDKDFSIDPNTDFHKKSSNTDFNKDSKKNSNTNSKKDSSNTDSNKDSNTDSNKDCNKDSNKGLPKALGERFSKWFIILVLFKLFV